MRRIHCLEQITRTISRLWYPLLPRPVFLLVWGPFYTPPWRTRLDPPILETSSSVYFDLYTRCFRYWCFATEYCFRVTSAQGKIEWLTRLCASHKYIHGHYRSSFRLRNATSNFFVPALMIILWTSLGSSRGVSFGHNIETWAIGPIIFTFVIFLMLSHGLLWLQNVLCEFLFVWIRRCTWFLGQWKYIFTW